MQFGLALTCLEVLLNVCQLPPSLYQTALATYCRLGVRESADICWGTMEKKLLGAVRGEVGGRGRSPSDLVTSFLNCRLALATIYLHRGEVSGLLSGRERGELCLFCRLTDAGKNW